VRPGVRIACDVGTVRIGIARSDATGMLAVPLDAVAAAGDSVARVLEIMAEWEAVEAFVGLPLHMSGQEGASADLARAWAVDLAERTQVPVRLIDERLSTVQAQRGLHAGGRSARESRSRIDSASAVVVLQSALDSEQGTGVPVGERVDGGVRQEEGQT
jgi:putative Holliday junction resolvase